MRSLTAILVVALALGADTAGPDRTDDWPTTRLVINLNGKERISVRRTSLDKKPSGSVWRGEIAGTSEPVLLMRWKDLRFSGMFVYRGQTYTLDRLTTIAGEVHAVVAANPARNQQATVQSDEGRTALGARAITARMPGRHRSPAEKAATATEHAGFAPLSSERRQELAAKKVTIDVMVLYTHSVAARYVDIETDLIEHSIAEANLSFVNSGIGNIKLRLAHSQQIDYAETSGEHFDHLYRMVDGVGAFTSVAALRNAKRADVVVLVVDDPSSCGLATRVAADAEEAFAVVHHACAALTYSLPHEIGHIIGARHDRSLDQHASPFPYGHGFVNGTKWRDIMSYRASCDGCPRLPFWSNPAIEINGEPAGTVYADNARVLLEQAARVASFR